MKKIDEDNNDFEEISVFLTSSSCFCKLFIVSSFEI